MKGKNMPPSDSSISLVSHTPDHGDGTIHMDDTVVFEITGTGVINAYASRDGGPVMVAWSNFRGDLDIELTPSLAYTPGPLHVDVELREQVGHRVKTVAETSFEISE